jgi:hypothetical protein
LAHAVRRGVQNLRAMELDSLREAFWMSKKTRIEQLKARLEHITAEVDGRGFSDVPTEKLLELEQKARDELKHEVFGNIRSEEELKEAKAAGISSPPEDVLFPSLYPRNDQSARVLEAIPLLIQPKQKGNEGKRSRRAD